MHLDESCLGNGRAGDNPGGAGGLVEVRVADRIERRDLRIHAAATTNNRMALTGAIEMLRLLAAKGNRLGVLVVSDSEYLVKGVREWAPSWQRRGWTRKGGPIENLALWQELWSVLPLHDVQFTWVRGHAGHPRNEYVDELAVAAATKQSSSAGLEPSGFDRWLAAKQAARKFPGHDPEAAFEAQESRLLAGERFPQVEGR